MKTKYEIWPIGKLPKHFQRSEINDLENKGYDIKDPRDIVYLFERKVADYAGAKHAIAVDNCTDAIFLCLKLLQAFGLDTERTISVPKRSYLSIPMSIINAGFNLQFDERDWQGVYQLKPYPVYDSATRFTRGMYITGSLQCLSFQIKKRLPIGKGGMILTNNAEHDSWLRRASFEGRNLEFDQWEDEYSVIGWNMYMAPEDAARGIIIMDELPEINEDTATQDNYPDLSQKKVFQKYIK